VHDDFPVDHRFNVHDQAVSCTRFVFFTSRVVDIAVRVLTCVRLDDTRCCTPSPSRQLQTES